MKNDGKKLEALIAHIEKMYLPQGFDVISNEDIYDDDGNQIAEFDIQISGKLGTTQIKWLIECRDRPSQGSAPGSWIEQLVGRRGLFGFNKVTAVSTTGFAPGASDFAKKEGIELREVTEVSIDTFSQSVIDNIIIREFDLSYESAVINSSSATPNKIKEAAKKILATTTQVDPILKSTKTGQTKSLSTAFFDCSRNFDNYFDTFKPNGLSNKVELMAEYPYDHDHFVIETKFGNLRIQSILFKANLRIVEQSVLAKSKSEYRHFDTGEAISQNVDFVSQLVSGINIKVSIQGIPEKGK